MLKKSHFVFLLVILFAIFTLVTANLVSAIEKSQLANLACEADVYKKAIYDCVSQVTKLEGLNESDKVGVLIVRELQGKQRSIPSLAKKYSQLHSFLMIVPIVGFFQRDTIAPWAVGTIAYEEPLRKKDNTIIRNVAVEDALITELVNSARFNVIETIQPFYSQIEKLVAEHEKLETKGGLFAHISSLLVNYEKNPLLISEIGKIMGVDTMIIGSTVAMTKKVIEDDNFWRKEKHFWANYSLHLRTVDVATNKITSGKIFTGTATRRMTKKIKVGNILYGLFQLWCLANWDDIR